MLRQSFIILLLIGTLNAQYLSKVQKNRTDFCFEYHYPSTTSEN